MAKKGKHATVAPPIVTGNGSGKGTKNDSGQPLPATNY